MSSYDTIYSGTRKHYNNNLFSRVLVTRHEVLIGNWIYLQIVPTSTYNAVANLHNLNLTTALAMYSISSQEVAW
jgi:hypothetical protein